MDDKESKKRAFLAKFVKSAEQQLVHGVRSLRYWCYEKEALECEENLKKYLEVLNDSGSDKQSVMVAVSGVEENSFYMMCLFNQGFCGLNDYKINPEFIEEVDKNYMNYAIKVEKSVNAKQSHAPGFD